MPRMPHCAWRPSRALLPPGDIGNLSLESAEFATPSKNVDFDELYSDIEKRCAQANQAARKCSADGGLHRAVLSFATPSQNDMDTYAASKVEVNAWPTLLLQHSHSSLGIVPSPDWQASLARFQLLKAGADLIRDEFGHDGDESSPDHEHTISAPLALKLNAGALDSFLLQHVFADDYDHAGKRKTARNVNPYARVAGPCALFSPEAHGQNWDTPSLATPEGMEHTVPQRLASEHENLSMLVCTESTTASGSFGHKLFCQCCPEVASDIPVVATIAVDDRRQLPLGIPCNLVNGDDTPTASTRSPLSASTRNSHVHDEDRECGMTSHSPASSVTTVLETVMHASV